MWRRCERYRRLGIVITDKGQRKAGDQQWRQGDGKGRTGELAGELAAEMAGEMVLGHGLLTQEGI